MSDFKVTGVPAPNRNRRGWSNINLAVAQPAPVAENKLKWERIERPELDRRMLGEGRYYYMAVDRDADFEAVIERLKGSGWDANVLFTFAGWSAEAAEVFHTSLDDAKKYVGRLYGKLTGKGVTK